MFWKLLTEFKFDKFLEIGMYQGLTTGLFFDSNKQASVVAIDPFEHISLFDDIYSEHKINLTFIKKQSQDVDLSGQVYDFILIDGDHSYQMARNDIFKCLPCLQQHSILAIDDYKMPGVAKAIEDLYNTNNDWVPFLQSEQTQFWHHRGCDRGNFLDSLLTNVIANFIFLHNITDHHGNTVCSATTLKIFTDRLDFFNLALEQFDV
jgi:hypothetical protein